MKTKTTAVFLLLACLYFTGHTQTITGQVMDAKTRETIPGAAVYLSGTYLGTSTDADGRFELDVTGRANMPVTVSAMGYYSFIVKDHAADKPLTVRLKPKIFDLQEVVVEDKSLQEIRRKHMAIFRREFLGNNSNARNCEILNEWDIRFTMDEATRVLSATASKPIEIKNHNLGYHITYYLDKFEFCITSGDMLLIGNFLFSPEDVDDPRQLARIEQRRERAYLGSRMHFLRALWRSDLTGQEYRLAATSGAPLDYEELVTVDTRWGLDKYLNPHDTVAIFYRTNGRRSLLIIPPDYGEVYFEEDGYFEPYGIIWSGEMGRSRIADLLPYEYGLPN
jgi:hypothetical protein